MKKLLLATVALAGFGAPAVAADLPARTYTKAPAYVAAIYDWSGFYIGGNGGYGTSRNCFDFVSPGAGTRMADGCHDATGAVAGGQIGYRLQSGAFVYGIEAQGDWADLSGANTSVLAPTVNNRTRIEAFGLFTGQVGYAWNNALLYAKGGAAVADDKYDGRVAGSNAVIDSARETRWGGVAGVGLEYGFSPSWSAAVEYDHIFLGDRNVTFNAASTGTPTRIDRVRQDSDLVTARINYRWGGPVIGKY